jgi:hypothetical protein
VARSEASSNALRQRLAEIGSELEAQRKNAADLIEEMLALKANVDKELNYVSGSLVDLNELLTDFNKTAEASRTRMASLAEELQARIVSFDERIAALESADAGDSAAATATAREEMKRVLAEEKRVYQQMLGLVTKRLDGQLDGIREDIARLKQSLSLLRQSKESSVRGEARPRTNTPPSIEEQAIQ